MSDISDPRKQFIGMLVKNIDNCYYQIYSHSAAERNHGAVFLIGLIDVLSEDSQKFLKPIRDRLTNFNGIKESEDLYECFSQVNMYLQKTYLEGMYRAQPRIKDRGHLGSDETP